MLNNPGITAMSNNRPIEPQKLSNLETGAAHCYPAALISTILEATAARAGLMKFLSYVQESIAALGYIKPEFDTALAIMLEANEGQNPTEIARKYREIGEQLSRDEKRALGLKANAFFSRQALESLTEKGRSNIKDALATTLLRAMFGFFRDRTIARAKAADIHQFRVSPSHSGCPACDRLNGQLISSNEAAFFPPPDCAREACSVWLTPWKDFFGRSYVAHSRRTIG